MIEDIFLFIIWNKAYVRKDDILTDLKGTFEIIKVLEVQWSIDHFTENLNRFYGEKLPKNSFKEKACGTGPFTLVVFRDRSPEYSERKTTRGEMERVNIRTFDKKKLYRSWTNDKKGHNCVHGTNTPEETCHDLTLLTGMSPEDFLNRSGENLTIGDIAGCGGWKDEKEMFYILDHTCRYKVISEDSDTIRIATPDPVNTARIIGGRKFLSRYLFPKGIDRKISVTGAEDNGIQPD